MTLTPRLKLNQHKHSAALRWQLRARNLLPKPQQSDESNEPRHRTSDSTNSRGAEGLGSQRGLHLWLGSKRHDERGSDVDFAVAGLPPQEFFKALSAAGRISPGPLDLVDLDEATPFTRYLKEEAELRRVA